MRSPFPGMDPYLEDPAFWPDFHYKFINYWHEALADVLPGDYEARIGERVYLIEHDPDTRKLIYPDVAVSEGQRTEVGSSGAAAVATLEPVTIPVSILEGPREAYVEILHRPERSLVTVLELPSPANKNQSPGRAGPAPWRLSCAHGQTIAVGGFFLHHFALGTAARCPGLWLVAAAAVAWSAGAAARAGQRRVRRVCRRFHNGVRARSLRAQYLLPISLSRAFERNGSGVGRVRNRSKVTLGRPFRKNNIVDRPAWCVSPLEARKPACSSPIRR